MHKLNPWTISSSHSFVTLFLVLRLIKVVVEICQLDAFLDIKDNITPSTRFLLINYRISKGLLLPCCVYIMWSMKRLLLLHQTAIVFLWYICFKTTFTLNEWNKIVEKNINRIHHVTGWWCGECIHRTHRIGKEMTTRRLKIKGNFRGYVKGKYCVHFNCIFFTIDDE